MRVDLACLEFNVCIHLIEVCWGVGACCALTRRDSAPCPLCVLSHCGDCTSYSDALVGFAVIVVSLTILEAPGMPDRVGITPAILLFYSPRA